MNAMAHNLTDGGNTPRPHDHDIDADVSYANLLNISVPAFYPGTSHEWMPWNAASRRDLRGMIYGSLIDLDTNMSVTSVYERYGMCMWEEPKPTHGWSGPRTGRRMGSATW